MVRLSSKAKSRKGQHSEICTEGVLQPGTDEGGRYLLRSRKRTHWGVASSTLYSSNRHRQIGALLSGSNSSARFDLTPTNFLFARQRGASLLSFPVRPPKDINSDLTREEAMDARSIIHIYSYDAKEVKLYLRG